MQRRPAAAHWCVAALLATALPIGLAREPARASNDWIPAVVEIPPGPFIAGSDRKEREAAYRLDGRAFPWGDEFDALRLNSHDAGPFDTTRVGAFPDGASPYGVLDAAGEVYEWTATLAAPGRAIVKGGSWDDRGCGVCRPAARHARAITLKHILIGFRLVRDVPAGRPRSANR